MRSGLGGSADLFAKKPTMEMVTIGRITSEPIKYIVSTAASCGTTEGTHAPFFAGDNGGDHARRISEGGKD